MRQYMTKAQRVIASNIDGQNTNTQSTEQSPKRVEGDEEEEAESWKDKPHHGMYHRHIEEVADIGRSYQ